MSQFSSKCAYLVLVAYMSCVSSLKLGYIKSENFWFNTRQENLSLLCSLFAREFYIESMSGFAVNIEPVAGRELRFTVYC